MAINKKTREQVYQKYKGHCAYCGEEISITEMQVDHIFAQAKIHWIGHEGMKRFHNDIPDNINELNNLNPACRFCNAWKKTFSIEQFRSEISEQVKRANKYSANYRMAKRYKLIEERTMPIVFYFEKVSCEQT